jgi:hypothetical protein
MSGFEKRRPFLKSYFKQLQNVSKSGITLLKSYFFSDLKVFFKIISDFCCREGHERPQAGA